MGIRKGNVDLDYPAVMGSRERALPILTGDFITNASITFVMGIARFENGQGALAAYVICCESVRVNAHKLRAGQPSGG
jgi:hypothetical protein